MSHDQGHSAVSANPAPLDHRPYLAAILAGDRQRATAVIHALSDQGYALRSIYLDILQPALREIGDRWQGDMLNVAEEHMATAVARATMAHLTDPLDVPSAPDRGLAIVSACPDDEGHDLGLQMFCDLAGADGWNVYSLGAAVPSANILDMVGQYKPAVLALSATLRAHVPQLAALIRGVRAKFGQAAPLIAVGGLALLDHPEDRQQLDADIVAKDAGVGLDQLNARFPKPCAHPASD